MKKSKLVISYLPGADVVVLNQDDGVFISTKESVIIGRNSLIAILIYLVKNDMISKEDLKELNLA